MDLAEIERIAIELMDAHGCHTAILYGSWARGDATPESDVDFMWVRADGEPCRDAHIRDGVYIDGFVYPESALATPEPELLRLLGGKVIRERAGFGHALLARIQALSDAGPKPMRPDERRAVLRWSRKMLQRFEGKNGLDASFRRMQLLSTALEDYFAFRGEWFRGPKAAFAYLLQHDAETHRCFERATEPGAGDGAFADLVTAVYGPFERELGEG
ncbi:MAG: nucleotidyltransferase domain-containing protein [Myxococcales bacterium]|nr:nucleotidyltransferase domain-containing protein [Myxococcales bacterium]